jgi:hypothetical protein
MVACDEVTGGRIVECGLFQQSVVWDWPTLYRVEAYDGVRIYGNATLIGPMKLYGDARIMAGVWHRAPRYVHLGFCFITEGPPGWVMVDCKFNSYAGWFRTGDRFARRYYNWTPAMLAQVRTVLSEWQATENLAGKHWGKCVSGCAIPLALTVSG